MNKILKISGFIAVVAAVVTLLSFVGTTRSASICEALEIQFLNDSALGLVPEMQIRNTIIEFSGLVIGDALGEIDTREIETAVISLPHVRDAAVYKTIDKKVRVEITEREPMARLIDQFGAHALLDSEGFLMPLSSHASPRLPVVSGRFSLPENGVATCPHISDSLVDPLLQGVFTYSTEIARDPFWTAQLQHTEVDGYGDFIAHPQVGGHTINFGAPTDILRKLGMLQTLYKKGMSEANWNKYSAINLKYRDQIVCTKK